MASETSSLAWDRHTHQTLAASAISFAPKELKDIVGPKSRTLMDAAVGSDSEGMRQLMHGAKGSAKLVALLDDARRLAEAGTLSETELASRLGLISHLVADIYAPQDLQAPTSLTKWLDNNTTVFYYDGPAALDSSSGLVSIAETLVRRLDPTRDLGSLRLDQALNAVLDAWQYVTETRWGKWPDRVVVAKIGRGTDWAEQGFGITEDEVRLGEHERKVEESRAATKHAEQNLVARRGDYEAALDQYVEADLWYEGRDRNATVTAAKGQYHDAREGWYRAIEQRSDAKWRQHEMETAPVPVVRQRDKEKVEYERAHEKLLQVLEQSVLLEGGRLYLVARLRNNSPDFVTAIAATVDPPGLRVSLSVKVIPPGGVGVAQGTATGADLPQGARLSFQATSGPAMLLAQQEQPATAPAPLVPQPEERRREKGISAEEQVLASIAKYAEILRSNEPVDERLRAVERLLQLGDLRAIPILQEVANTGGSTSVMRAAKKAIERLEKGNIPMGEGTKDRRQFFEEGSVEIRD